MALPGVNLEGENFQPPKQEKPAEVPTEAKKKEVEKPKKPSWLKRALGAFSEKQGSEYVEQLAKYIESQENVERAQAEAKAVETVKDEVQEAIDAGVKELDAELAADKQTAAAISPEVAMEVNKSATELTEEEKTAATMALKEISGQFGTVGETPTERAFFGEKAPAADEEAYAEITIEPQAEVQKTETKVNPETGQIIITKGEHTYSIIPQDNGQVMLYKDRRGGPIETASDEDVKVFADSVLMSLADMEKANIPKAAIDRIAILRGKKAPAETPGEEMTPEEAGAPGAMPEVDYSAMAEGQEEEEEAGQAELAGPGNVDYGGIKPIEAEAETEEAEDVVAQKIVETTESAELSEIDRKKQLKELQKKKLQEIGNPYNRTAEEQNKFAWLEIYDSLNTKNNTDKKFKDKADELRKKWAAADKVGIDYPADSEQYKLQTGEAIRQALEGTNEKPAAQEEIKQAA